MSQLFPLQGSFVAVVGWITWTFYKLSLKDPLLAFILCGTIFDFWYDLKVVVSLCLALHSAYKGSCGNG